MVQEAALEPRGEGLVPKGEGWYVVNMKEARWERTETFGDVCTFEGEDEFPQFGFNVQVLQPGQPNCMYHGESNQEAFLVLSGEPLLIVEGEERRLRQWDFVYCPPHTRHVFVGAGDRPAAILMVGTRDPDEEIVYPVDETALRHRAGVETETPNPREAYAPFNRETVEIPAPVDGLP